MLLSNLGVKVSFENDFLDTVNYEHLHRGLFVTEHVELLDTEHVLESRSVS